LKDIAVFFDGSETGQHVLDIAADLAAIHHAHLIGICANVNPDIIPEDGFARGEAAHDVMERHRSAVEAHLLQAGKCLAKAASRRNVNAEFRMISNTNAGSEIALHSLYCDLVVVGSAQAQAAPSAWSPEQALRRSGVPLLIVPPTWGDNAVGRRIIVAWNASRQARRAIADALPLLVAAHWVELLLVDPERRPGQHGPEPGADMAAYLARHGVEIEVKRLATRKTARSPRPSSTMRSTSTRTCSCSGLTATAA